MTRIQDSSGVWVFELNSHADANTGGFFSEHGQRKESVCLLATEVPKRGTYRAWLVVALGVAEAVVVPDDRRGLHICPFIALGHGIMCRRDCGRHDCGPPHICPFIILGRGIACRHDRERGRGLLRWVGGLRQS